MSDLDKLIADLESATEQAEYVSTYCAAAEWTMVWWTNRHEILVALRARKAEAQHE